MIRMTVERIRKESPIRNSTYKAYSLSMKVSADTKTDRKTDMVPKSTPVLEAFAKRKALPISIFSLFTEGTNVLRSGLTGDGLHLNEDGYKIWVKAIKKKI